MKIRIFFAALAALVLASCSDSEEARNYGKEIAGTYTGSTVASCAYFSGQTADNQSVILTATADNDKVALSFDSETWGKINVSDATVTLAGKQYTITGTGISQMGHEGNVKDYTCNISGTVTGAGSAQFTFSCPQIMGGLTIEFTSGTSPAQ